MDHPSPSSPPSSPLASSPARWTSRRIIFLGIVGAVAVASVTAGVRLMNAQVRDDAAALRDTRRFDDLQLISDMVGEIYQKEGRLPQTLDEVRAKSPHPVRTGDPQTFEIYEYKVLDGTRAEMCAKFEEAGFGHENGRSCLTFEAKAE